MGADLHFPDNDQQADACAAGQPENHILINAVEFSCRKGADCGADAAEHPRPAKFETGGAADFINVGFANPAAGAVGHANIKAASQRAEEHIYF